MPIGVTPGEVSVERVVLPLGPFGNGLVETVDSAVRYSVHLQNPGGDVLTNAETTPGTYAVHRIRAGTDTEIVGSTAATESNGVISVSVDFTDGNWAEGDLGYIEFSGIAVTIDDVTSSLPTLRKGFRVSEAGFQDVPAADSTNNGQMRDVVGNKEDGAQTTVGVISSLMGYIKGILGFHSVPAADSADNAQTRDVVGNKQDAAVATPDNVSSLVAYIKALLAQGVGGRLVYASIVQPTVTLPALAADQSLPSVTVGDLPAVLTINRVIAAIAWRKQVNSSLLANAIDGTQQIQVRSDAPGTFRNAITISDNSLATGANSTEGGIMLLGDSDISVEVVGADTYEFQWTAALVDEASLTLHDVQTYIIIEYS